jgi:hypothetical protein
MLRKVQKNHSEAWEERVSAANERKERLWQAWYTGELTRAERRRREWGINSIVEEEKRRSVEGLEDREREIEIYVKGEVEKVRKEWERKTREFAVREEDSISWVVVGDDG